MTLRTQHFLTLLDFTPEQISDFLSLAAQVKQEKQAGVFPKRLANKNIALLFEKTSTRTRCAFEVAAMDEGAGVTFLTNSQMGKKESIEDTAKVLGRMYDGIEFRGFAHSTVEMLAEHAGVPVWNGLTDLYHPTQILADFLTIQEHGSKPLSDIKLVYVGDTRNNVANSLMIGAAKLGMHYVGLGPKALSADDKLVSRVQEIAEKTGAKIAFSDELDVVEHADVIYTDVWVSMGEEALFAERIEMLKAYQVNEALMAKTGNSHTLFMHCLPAYHDTHTEVGKQIHAQFGLEAMEVTDAVFRGENSVVFDQAENRLHTIKAIMLALLGNVSSTML